MYSNPAFRRPNAGPRWLVLPPEILRIILQYLAKDKKTLRACSRTAREFRHVALSLLGRHLNVNDVNRVKECARLITGGAFQHVRSLDLGTDYRPVILEEYWKNYTVILGSFARFHSLNRLWLSEVPFTFLRPDQRKTSEQLSPRWAPQLPNLGYTDVTFPLTRSWYRSFALSLSAISSSSRIASLDGNPPTGMRSLGFLSTTLPSKISSSPLPRQVTC